MGRNGSGNCAATTAPWPTCKTWLGCWPAAGSIPSGDWFPCRPTSSARCGKRCKPIKNNGGSAEEHLGLPSPQTIDRISVSRGNGLARGRNATVLDQVVQDAERVRPRHLPDEA